MSDYSDYLKREPKYALAKKLKITSWILTGAVLVLVGLMRRPELKFDLPVSMAFLPPVHAVLNSLVAIALIFAIIMIKKKNVKAHKAWISFAMICSVLFLLCYVAYHFTEQETIFGDTSGDHILSDEEKAAAGSMRSVYLFVLISHIVLAGVSLPFILYTWLFGATNQFAKHKKLAKWVAPLWLYVAITGPICYFMLKPYY